MDVKLLLLHSEHTQLFWLARRKRFAARGIATDMLLFDVGEWKDWQQMETYGIRGNFQSLARSIHLHHYIVALPLLVS